MSRRNSGVYDPMFSKLAHIPHLNLIASILFATLVFGIGLWMRQTPKTPPLAANSPAAQPAEEPQGDRDSDRDGLPDWQEALYGSDMEKTDSDGDGALDGDEVRSGRDPSKKGPNDQLAVIPNFATSSDDALGLKQEFYAQFLKNNGDILRETTIRELVGQIDPRMFGYRYNIVDLNITASNDKEALRAYGSAFGALIDTYTKKNGKNELEILRSAIPQKDSAALAELQLPAVNYRNFVADLRKIRVPSTAAKDHLAIVNSYDVVSRSLVAMIQLFRNPIIGQAAYQAYMKQTYHLIGAYSGIGTLLFKNGIVYQHGEPGYYWSVTVPATSTIAVKGSAAPHRAL